MPLMIVWVILSEFPHNDSSTNAVLFWHNWDTIIDFTIVSNILGFYDPFPF